MIIIIQERMMTSWRLHKKGPAWKQLFGGFSPLGCIDREQYTEVEEQSNLNYAYISDKKAAYEIANNKST